MMKAAVFQGRGRPHSIESVAPPTPGPGQVLVQVECCGICGSDLSLASPTADLAQFGPGLEEEYSAGSILGHETAGTVVAVGEGVTRLAIGDRVASMALAGCGGCEACAQGMPVGCAAPRSMIGGYAEYALAHDRFSVRLPDGISFEQGALIEPFATSYHAVARMKVTPGSRVAIFGAGTIGLGLALFARLVGAERVAVIARTDARAAIARDFGATSFLRVSPDLATEAAAALGGMPDLVFEAAGSTDAVARAVDIIAPAGTLAITGLMTKPGTMPHGLALLKQLTIQYMFVYRLSDFDAVVDHMRAGRIPTDKLPVDTVDLAGFPARFEALRAGDASHVRTMLTPRR